MLLYLLSISDESDHGKITELYEEYYDFLLKYSINQFKYHRRTNYLYDAEDAVQNTFVRITKNIKTIDFSGGKKRVQNLIFTILTHEIVNILREGEEILEFHEEFYDDPAYTFVDKLSMAELYDDVVRALENLDDKYRATLQLVYNEEMTVNQIADMMGLSAKTVYTRLERARKLVMEAVKGAEAYGKK